MKNEIIAVVVTHNRCEMLKRCIAALQSQSHICDVLIVDNASTDSTEEWTIDCIKSTNNLYYINTGKNVGGAGGFNKGIRWAVAKEYAYVWIMDDDCIPCTDALEKLMQADIKLNGKYGFLSSVVLWTDGTECKMNRQKINKHYYENIHLFKDCIIQVEQATFVSLFLPVSVINKVGLPIKEFFIWGDDIEYTRRIAVRNNLSSYMVGNSMVIHVMKDNTGSSIATDDPERIDRYRYAFRNENYLYRQEGIKGFVYYIAKCGLNLLRILTKAKTHKVKRSSIVLGGMVKGLWFNPKIEKV